VPDHADAVSDRAAPDHGALPPGPAEVFGTLTRGVCDQRWDELAALYAERTHVVHPMDPDRAPPLRTRAELDQHFHGGAEVLGDVRFEAAAIRVHQSTDPEVIVAEFEYRGTVPGTGEPFAIPNIFVMRVRDGLIVESRDYADHARLGQVLGRPARQDAAPEDWAGRAQRRYEDAVFGGDDAALDAADAELNTVEAGLAMARGRVRHARFLAGAAADPAELAEFERAARLYAAMGDPRGEADAVLWTALYHQVVRDDDDTARPLLERARELAIAAGDRLILSYVVRHLGFAELGAGRLAAGQAALEQSLTLRRELGFGRGVAAALLALAELAAGQGDPVRASALLDEAGQAAAEHDAGGIARRVQEARAALPARA
jgi:ketosteroid isomerase-like protein